MQKAPITPTAFVYSAVQTREKIKKLIAPAWPLKDSVAVNPFHGYTDYSFDKAAHLFKNLAGIELYMPLSFYRKMFSEKKILESDIREALKASGYSSFTVERVLNDMHALPETTPAPPSIETITDLSEKLSGIKLNDFFIETISTWASSYFGKNGKTIQEHPKNLYKAWKIYASTDYSTELIGIPDFRRHLKEIPDDAESAFQSITTELKLDEEQLTWYLLRLAYQLTGWSSLISGMDWNGNLYGGKTDSFDQFITILLSWEFCLYKAYQNKGVATLWRQKNEHTVQKLLLEEPKDSFRVQAILQQAFELAGQRELRKKFAANHPRQTPAKPVAQAVFCIDVRSEVYRRNLESTEAGIQTIGFAGFFGFPIKYQAAGTSTPVNQCPVLLPSGPLVKETADAATLKKLKTSRIVYTQTKETVKGFKSGALTSFGFVSSLGLFFLPKLVSDSLRLTRTVSKTAQRGYSENYLVQREIDLSDFPFEDQVNLALGTLNTTGLSKQCAPIVLFVGHGSSSVNNPHAAGLECGACGGHSGDINALVAASICNNPEVRKALAAKGVNIPEETLFLAGLHDTTSDHIAILNAHLVSDSHRDAFKQLTEKLALASEQTRKERSRRLNVQPEQSNKNLPERSKDWAQVRPEWGLAGCNSFVIAPRTKTKDLNLEGKTFLHDYHFQQDHDLKILETIITAPMIVTTWINLQYYASTVDNRHFGAGDKTIHNVTAGIGVMEGSSGDLRIGLPLQSVHTGTGFEHLPQRLNVFIDAPVSAINEILAKHPTVRNLFDNKWIHLFRLNNEGTVSEQYVSGLHWKSFINKQTSPEEIRTLSTAE